MSSALTYLPLIAAVLSLVLAAVKHTKHATIADLLEEALVLEREREVGTPLGDLLNEAAHSKAAQDVVDEITARVAARVSPKT